MTITPMIPTPPLLEFISISYSSAMAAIQPHCDTSLGVPAFFRQLWRRAMAVYRAGDCPGVLLPLGGVTLRHTLHDRLA
jgi:hypothetical protein